MVLGKISTGNNGTNGKQVKMAHWC